MSAKAAIEPVLKGLATVLPSGVMATLSFVARIGITPVVTYKDTAIYLFVIVPALVGAALAHVLPWIPKNEAIGVERRTKRTYLFCGAVLALLLILLYYRWTNDEPNEQNYYYFDELAATLMFFAHMALGYIITLSLLYLIELAKPASKK